MREVPIISITSVQVDVTWCCVISCLVPDILLLPALRQLEKLHFFISTIWWQMIFCVVIRTAAYNLVLKIRSLWVTSKLGTKPRTFINPSNLLFNPHPAWNRTQCSDYEIFWWATKPELDFISLLKYLGNRNKDANCNYSPVHWLSDTCGQYSKC